MREWETVHEVLDTTYKWDSPVLQARVHYARGDYLIGIRCAHGYSHSIANYYVYMWSNRRETWCEGRSQLTKARWDDYTAEGEGLGL